MTIIKEIPVKDQNGNRIGKVISTTRSIDTPGMVIQMEIDPPHPDVLGLKGVVVGFVPDVVDG